MSNLAQRFQRTKASLEAQQAAAAAAAESAALESLRADFSHEGEYSEINESLESIRDARAGTLAEVATALAGARNDCIDACDFGKVHSQLSATREAMNLINSRGGFSMESLHYATLAADAALAPCRILAPITIPSMESFGADEKHVVSLEGIDSLLNELAAVKGDVEGKSVDAILRALDALRDALPEVKERMLALQQSLPDVIYDETKEIRIDELIFKSLAVDGRLPTGFKDYFVGYGQFANRVLAGFAENALVAANKAGELGDNIAAIPENACPIEALLKLIKDIADPRDSMDADQLCFVLPGSGPLFGAPSTEDATDAAVGVAQGEEAPDAAAQIGESMVDNTPVPSADDDKDQDPVVTEVKARLAKFTESRIALDPLAWGDRPAPEGEVPTLRVLSKDTIAGVLGELIKAFEIIDIKTYGETHRQTWIQARAANGKYQQSKDQLQAVQVAALRPLDESMTEYLDEIFDLSCWPALHLLANMAFTANGFLLLAERSISGKSEEAPMTPDAPLDGEEAESVVDSDGVAIVAGGMDDDGLPEDVSTLSDGGEEGTGADKDASGVAIVATPTDGAPVEPAAVEGGETPATPEAAQAPAADTSAAPEPIPADGEGEGAEGAEAPVEGAPAAIEPVAGEPAAAIPAAAAPSEGETGGQAPSDADAAGDDAAVAAMGQANNDNAALALDATTSTDEEDEDEKNKGKPV